MSGGGDSGAIGRIVIVIFVVGVAYIFLLALNRSSHQGVPAYRGPSDAMIAACNKTQILPKDDSWHSFLESEFGIPDAECERVTSEEYKRFAIDGQ